MGEGCRLLRNEASADVRRPENRCLRCEARAEVGACTVKQAPTSDVQSAGACVLQPALTTDVRDIERHVQRKGQGCYNARTVKGVHKAAGGAITSPEPMVSPE